MKKLEIKKNLRPISYGIRKAKLKLTDEGPCSKCKYGCKKPLFTKKPTPDRGPRLMVITEYAHGFDSGVSPKEYIVLQEAFKNCAFPYRFITPVVKCKLDKTPTKPVIELCEDYLREEIKTIKPDVIICMGKAPASVFNISGRIDHLKMGAYQFGDAKVIVTYPFEKILESYKYKSEFFKAIAKANRFITGEGEVDLNYEAFESPEEFSKWVDLAIESEATLAADIETTGLDPRAADARVRTISFTPRPGRSVVVIYDQSYYQHLKRLMESKAVKFIFHNATYDVAYMRVVLGIYTENVIGDTMLMAYLLNPGLGKWGYPLKPLAQEWTDLGGYDTDINKDEFSSMDIFKLATYNCCDTDATFRLYQIFYEELKEQEMLAVNKLLADAIQVICDLETNGVQIDKDFVKDTIPRMEVLVEQYERELTELAGGAYDWNSPKEMDHLLYDILKHPRPEFSLKDTATDDDSLDRLNTPFANTLRKHRKATKLLGTYFKGYFSKVEDDGRLRADYNLHATRTGRLSSDDPNLQNLSRGMNKDDLGYEELHTFKVKNAIVARPGWKLLAADESQVEMRVAAMLSGDQKLMNVYLNKLDMHSANAILSFNLKPEVERSPEDDDISFTRKQHLWVKDNRGAERTAAKSVSFGILYCMSWRGLQFDLDSKTRSKGKTWEKDECQLLIDRFIEGYPKLAQWIKQMQNWAVKRGYSTTAFGRRRPINEFKSDEWYERAKGLRMAVNTPIQSCASDILVLALINIRNRIDPTRAKIVMTVHDSIVMEVREDYVNECAKIMKECMEKPLFCGKTLPFINIPLLAELEIGDKYGDMKGYKLV